MQKNTELAIISMSCRLPGANTVSELWDLISTGRTSIAEIPENRWSLDNFYDYRTGIVGKSVSKMGAFLNDVKSFDPKFFRIKPEDAVIMDPQQRILLELAYEAIISTKYHPQALSSRKIGVFLGITKSDYRDFVQKALQKQELTQSTVVVNVLENMTAARISHFFDFQGPSLTIDTACSSSLVALNFARDRIISGSSEMALVGGINLNLNPAPYLGMSAAGALSPGDRYYAFDQKSDGFFMGEGGGLILLKELDKAIKDKDHILGVLKGTYVNNDGRSVSPMAPRPQTQQDLLKEAYQKSGLALESVDYIEAHGTGTALGDAIEAQTLIQTFRNSSVKPYIGSIKPNIGHLLSGAGIASIIKVLLSFQHRQIPALVNYQNPRKEIGLEENGFILNKETVPARNKKMIAGINSFGFGGTNAHVILEEYQGNPSGSVFIQKVPDYHKQEYWLNTDTSIQSSKQKLFRQYWKADKLKSSELPPSKVLILGGQYSKNLKKSLIEILAAENAEYSEIFDPGTSYSDIIIINPSGYKSLFLQIKQINNTKKLWIITEKSLVLNDDKDTESNKILLSGLSFSAISELSVPVINIDFDDSYSDSEKANIIFQEIKTKDNDYLIAYRSKNRYVQDYKMEELDTSSSRIKENGVYLISGGAKGIGAEISKYFSRLKKIRIIALGRTEYNNIKDIDKLESIIKKHDSSFEYIQTDVSQEEELNDAFTYIISKYSRIDGIFHCAAIVNPQSFEQKTFNDFSETISVKVQGIKNIDTIITDTS